MAARNSAFVDPPGPVARPALGAGSASTLTASEVHQEAVRRTVSWRTRRSGLSRSRPAISAMPRCCRTCLPRSRRTRRVPPSPPTAPRFARVRRDAIAARSAAAVPGAKGLPDLFLALPASAPPQRRAMEAGQRRGAGAQRGASAWRSGGTGAGTADGARSRYEPDREKAVGTFSPRLTDLREAARPAADLRSASASDRWRRDASPSTARLPRSRSGGDPEPLHGPRHPGRRCPGIRVPRERRTAVANGFAQPGPRGHSGAGICIHNGRFPSGNPAPGPPPQLPRSPSRQPCRCACQHRGRRAVPRRAPGNPVLLLSPRRLGTSTRSRTQRAWSPPRRHAIRPIP